jgi:hypothetical protein
VANNEEQQFKNLGTARVGARAWQSKRGIWRKIARGRHRCSGKKRVLII